MAEEFLEKIYRYADAATQMEKLIDVHRINVGTSNFDMNVQPLVQTFAQIAKNMLEEYDMKGKELWESLKRLANYYSFVPILDELEGICLPIVREYLDSRPKIDVDDGKIRFKSSKYGFIYLSDVEKPDEPHNSCINPMKEAYCIAKNIYHPSKYKYVFLGAGLGYIPYQLYLLSEGEIDIHIFYYDKESYEYAKAYGVLDWIPDEVVHVTVSDSMTDFIKCATDKCDEYYFYPPDLKKYKESEQAKVDVYVRSNNTNYATRDILRDNFYRNIRRTDKFVSKFNKSDIKDRIIIVAGGPSVDDNIEFLENAHTNGMSVICVGTVFKKLIARNILPDLVTVCDPFISVASQFMGVETDSVPLLMGLETNWRVAKSYKGDKYLVALDGISGDTLTYVEKEDELIFPSAATVTSMAFNLAIYFGAKEIFLVGTDFGYPGKMSHAEGTAYRQEVNKTDLRLVEGVNGEVYSDPQMIAYREQMEEYIEKNPTVNVYNMSKTGAMIKGAKIYK